MTNATLGTRCAMSIAMLAAPLTFGTAIANHFILPCDDECSQARWAVTGSMATARELHTATLLPSGKVLVAGGRNIGPLDSAELYDPARGTWSAADRMNAARVMHTATLLEDGRVLVAGGDTGNEGPPTFGRTATAEIYDPATDTWTFTGSMQTPRSWFDATRLADGRVLAAGGYHLYTLGSAEAYDPATGRWTPVGDLNVARYGHTLTTLPDGSVLAVRGSDDDDLASTLSSAERFDPGIGKWSFAGDSGGGSVRHTATLLPDGKILITGGNAGGVGGNLVHAMAMVFHASSGRWQRIGDMSLPRYGHVASLMPDGRVHVAGGTYQIGGYPALEYHNPGSTETLSPGATSWSEAADLAAARTFATATLLPDGTVLVAGGSVVRTDYRVEVLSSAERLATPTKASIPRK